MLCARVAAAVLGIGMAGGYAVGSPSHSTGTDLSWAHQYTLYSTLVKEASMLKHIKNFFDQHLVPGAVTDETDPEHVVRGE
jgi:hypothetical protein